MRQGWIRPIKATLTLCLKNFSQLGAALRPGQIPPIELLNVNLDAIMHVLARPLPCLFRAKTRPQDRVPVKQPLPGSFESCRIHLLAQITTDLNGITTLSAHQPAQQPLLSG